MARMSSRAPIMTTWPSSAKIFILHPIISISKSCSAVSRVWAPFAARWRPQAKSKPPVQAAFDAWRGAPEALRLLTPDASWMITQLLGSRRPTTGRDEVHGTVIKPPRLTKPFISPTSRKCCGLTVEVGFTIEERDDRAVTVKTTGTILDADVTSRFRCCLTLMSFSGQRCDALRSGETGFSGHSFRRYLPR